MPYSEYKKTGQGWLGKVPGHWDLKPLWTLFRRVKRTGFPDEELLSVYRDYGVIPTASRDDNFNRPSEDLSSYQLVEPRDLVMNKMKTWQGSIAISEYRGLVSPAYFVYKPSHDHEPRYLHYLLRSPQYVAGYMQRSKGVRVNQWDLDPDAFSHLEVLLPPLPEQRAIANFLDRKTAEIDALLAEKQRLLELLEEKRTALITQAVTKGLDPDVEMKDSGVEWLGEIPAHWAAVRLRHVIDDIEQGWSPSCENREATEEEWGVLKTGCVNYGQFEPAEHKALPADEEPRPELEVKPGDVLMSRASGSPELIGSVALVTATRARLLLSDKLYRLRYRRRQILPGYLAEVLGAQTIRSQIRLSISGAGGLANNLAQSDVQDYWIPLPPVSEQAAIHEFLGQTATNTQELKQVCQVAIDHLHEYRTALISAAVTGKIDVREEAA